MPIDRGFEYLFSEHEWRTVRESVGTLSKFIPINKTLATANTAEDLINIDRLELPAMNLITNPSMVSTNYKMTTAIILSTNSCKDCFSWTAISRVSIKGT